MKLSDVNIRDPFIMPHEGIYYLYGTRSATCWGPADGFDCYTSKDLNEWEGPFEVFHSFEGFEPTTNYWAPEVYYHDGSFYFVTTFGGENLKKGIWILKSDSPKGPFKPWSDGQVTDKNQTCIDGTLYFEDGKPYLIYSRSFENDGDGQNCYQEMTPDLKAAKGEAHIMFHAEGTPWAKPFPWAKEEFGMDGDVYFTDGPCMHKLPNGTLINIWSSWSKVGYAVGVAVSDNGRLDGNWTHLEKPIFPENGGHGMMFRDFEGNLFYTLHYPNDKYKERPTFYRVTEKENTVELEGVE